MKVVSEAPSRAPAVALTDSRSTRRISPLAIAVAVIVITGVVLRFVTRSDLWLDEALTVNISRLPVRDIPNALRHDGAPPLYYVLLHAWMRVFGDGDFAVRSLSGVLSVAALPLAWFAGRRLGGKPVAWAAVVVFAASPFAIRYATEARMYALQVLLVTVGYLALLRLLERPTLARQAVVLAITGLLLYTQYWSAYLLIVVGLVLAWRAWRAHRLPERQAARSALVAMIAGLVTFVPWIPTFLYQNAHTGTPWGDPVLPSTSFAFALRDFAGGDHSEATALLVFVIALTAVAVFGRSIGVFKIEFDMRTRPGARREAAVWVAALLLGGTVAFVASTTFVGRYAAVVWPLFALVVAFGTMVFGDERVRAGVLAAVVALGFVGGVRNVLENRTQASQPTAIILREAKPGDVVLYCPDQIGPSVSRLLRGRHDLRQVTFPSGGDPRFVDWVDYIDRNRSANPKTFARRVLARAGVDHTIWYVIANQYRGGYEGKCDAVQAALSASRPGPALRVEPDDNYFEFQGLLQYTGR